MKIADIGGEFALIKRLTQKTYEDPVVVKGVGDDCAVLKYTDVSYLLVTVDMMVENDHFTLEWHSPYQIGYKLMEANVSDIIAMGGTPHWAFLSIALTPSTEVEFMDEFYRGLYASAESHGVHLIGGDTTHGGIMVVNLALLGAVEHDALRLRSMAIPGELICVTGTLGRSEAGLRLLKQGIRDSSVNAHLQPRCRRVWEGRIIARFCHAMIDVSDGLGSEVRHICEESGTGACIYWDKIPLTPETEAAARKVSADAHDFALYGGEDFELVFTIHPDSIEALRDEFSEFTVVGEILPASEGIYLVRDGQRQEVKKGFDHFA
ncbi:MAG: thiamine-phosphate kinase [Syntrophaceae bacterium]